MSKTKTIYGITVFFGVNFFTCPIKSYFVVDIVCSGVPRHYGHVSDSSKKRIESLIATWEKRVYFSRDGLTITAFNPYA